MKLFNYLIGVLLSISFATVHATVEVADDEYVVFYAQDIMGSPVAVSDDQGRVLWYENTEPYGKSLNRYSQSGELFPDSESEESATRLGYTGHERDSGSSLVYMKARFYDPQVGRFYSNDPVGFSTNNPMMFNRYAYGNNNPYKYIDPYGASGCSVIESPCIMVEVPHPYTNNDNDLAKNRNFAGLNAVTGAALAGALLALVYSEKKDDSEPEPSPEDESTESDVPKSAKRPSGFRKKTVGDSWDNAAPGTKPNTKRCPTCGNDVEGNPNLGEKRNGPNGWDNDHQPKWKDRDLNGMDRNRVLDEYNKDTQLRCRSCNRADN